MTATDTQLRRLATLLQSALDQGVEHTGIALSIQYHLDHNALTFDKALGLAECLETAIYNHNHKESAA